MLIAATDLKDAVASNGETGIVNTVVNTGKQLLAGKPFEWSEGVTLAALSAGTAWYFGHRKGYNDAALGKPYKIGGLI